MTESVPGSGERVRLETQVVRDYARGLITWSDIRRRFDIHDFSVVLRGLAEQRLRLPRAAADRPTEARGWLREVLAAAKVP